MTTLRFLSRPRVGQMVVMKDNIRHITSIDNDKLVLDNYICMPYTILGAEPRKTDDCPECYGTGYLHGFGAPCSKGCRPKE